MEMISLKIAFFFFCVLPLLTIHDHGFASFSRRILWPDRLLLLHLSESIGILWKYSILHGIKVLIMVCVGKEGVVLYIQNFP